VCHQNLAGAAGRIAQYAEEQVAEGDQVAARLGDRSVQRPARLRT
jgi:hypothetical protein